jgi:hypothetical protein
MPFLCIECMIWKLLIRSGLRIYYPPTSADAAVVGMNTRFACGCRMSVTRLDRVIGVGIVGVDRYVCRDCRIRQ